MKFFLTAKHWQLFLLLLGIPVLFQSWMISTIASGGNPASIFYWFPVLMTVMVALFFGWMYAVGTNLYKKLPANTSLSLTRFKIFLLVPAVYMLGICGWIAGTFMQQFNGVEAGVWIPALIVPLHLFSMFGVFHSMYFIAKALKTAEGVKASTFSDFAGEFFLIWFFPVGVWILQPRINAIFAKGQAPEDFQVSDAPSN